MSTSPWDSGQILRAELFSIERLEEHAASLAAAQPVTRRRSGGGSVGVRLKANESVLLAAYRAIAASAAEGNPVTPAAEWLLDNFHVVEEQIREIREDLPPSFYRLLPKLASGPLVGYPRVFGIAWAFVAHTDSRFDPEWLRRFIQAYQRVQPLTIGELWAAAITLRIVLVENLRRATELIVSSRHERQRADDLADRLLGVNGQVVDPDALRLLEDDGSILAPAFVVQSIQRLRDQDPQVTPALQWLEQQLKARGANSEDIVREEHQRQGASNVTVRNIIMSMRLLSDMDWPDFFESVSLVDELLRAGSEFAEMDFATRNLYRSAIERLARGSALSELEIAQAALSAAAAASSAGAESRQHDPGYHLIAEGRRRFESRVGYRQSFWSWCTRFKLANGAADYIGAITAVAALLLALPLALLHANGLSLRGLVVLGLLGAIPALDGAVSLVNMAILRGFRVRTLPGLALRGGVSAPLRTLLVVPALLTTRAAVEAQIERLEIHYLASAEGELHFALLSDWTDAAAESLPGDAALLQTAFEGVARLNRHYGPACGGARFLLLHRRRVWSPGQRQWMGWERKRGKLHELNRLLRGATDTTFIDLGAGVPWVPSDVRYVITLDADTRLPHGTARRLIGKMAHPLNRPRFDSATGHVIEGHAVLQPRVAPSLPMGREGSVFQRVFSSASGIDPYAGAVSDVYQDCFGEGSYAGKGIYEIDTFEAALAGRVPEGTLLSHDLFEGVFARAGLVSDIEVIEEFPSRYDVAAARQHRWARGDWQLLPWILGRRGGMLPLISLWKMLDNLRRTLSAPATLAALVAGWLLGHSAPLLWTVYVLAIVILPALLPVCAAILPRRTGIDLRSHLRALRKDAGLAAMQSALLLSFLTHQAWLMLDAIGRTLYRLCVSRRDLLQWVTAAQLTQSPQLDARNAYVRMAGGVVLAVGAALLVGVLHPAAAWTAAPFVLLWLAAPLIAAWVSVSPPVAGRLAVTAADAVALRQVARRTWRYFQTFVTPADHMLPPDNFQEDPKPVIAHRTSPTNIGIYLLSAVSARDFGWEGTLDTVERLEGTLATMRQLENFRGHLYNWYDTQDLRPLDPRYVSSVDSGNLAAHLIALANAAREWIGVPSAAAVARAGVLDAVDLVDQARSALMAEARVETESCRHLAQLLAALRVSLDDASQEAAGELAVRVAQLEPQAASLLEVAQALVGELGGPSGEDVLYWAQATAGSLASWRRDVELTLEGHQQLNRRLAAIETGALAMAQAMQFGFLLDPERRLLSIGYRPGDNTLDPSCYDLLASEARLASFVAIAKNDVPARHWFRLGRPVTSIGHGAALISWSGSMFEYLMPSLVMRAPAGSLLEQTSRLIVQRQISYGEELGVPWGVSESAYNARDLELTYQYSNFGVPGLGLKRGLSENTVIAPYATALASMVDPQRAALNFARLAKLGAVGRYGLYEALDYTRSRVPEGERYAIVRAFMSHHQGMSIVAIANVLQDGRMRERFHSEPSIRASELLLQERTPRDVSVVHPRAEEVSTAAAGSVEQLPEVRRLYSPHELSPQVHLLSNGRYSVMLTSVGSGYSRWQDAAVTRWREDSTREDSGSYLFLRDVESGAVWSAGYQPCGVEPERYEVTFTEDRAEFMRVDGTITTLLQVVVSPEDDAEVRRLSITNGGHLACDIDVTSYCELVLAPASGDTAHPAFSKMFVQTEYVAKIGAILATRRRRTPDEPEIWAAHHAVLEGGGTVRPEVETDRARFLGRGREVRAPLSVMDGRRLSNTVGTVLDPVFALRYRLHIESGATVHIAFWTGVAATRSAALDLIDKQQDPNAFVRAATLAWTQAQIQLRHLGSDAAESTLFQRLAGHVLFADASMRPSSDTIRAGAGAAAGLWSQGISGDVPIVLLRIDAIEDIPIARALLRAHEYWRMKQLAVDLVILNERSVSYVQDLQGALDTQLRMSQASAPPGAQKTRGAVFLLRTDQISPQLRALLSSVARVVLVGQRGSLADQLDRARAPFAPAARALPQRPEPPAELAGSASQGLEFFNGLGGFAAGGREYVTLLGTGQSTPAPWINVVTNAHFGFQVAAEGSGYTWALNSKENQLTPWSNDPVSDRPGEVLYVRDEQTGELWCPTAAPIRYHGRSYTARHGQGYSRFEHSAHGIALDLLMYVPPHDPIKISRLKLHNTSGRRRTLSVTAYVEWVLGPDRAASAPFLLSAMDPLTGALFASNPWNAQYGTRVAFMDLAGRQTQWTADRREFLGRHGTLARPAALERRAPWSRRTGAGLDPCGALQTVVELEAGQTLEIVLFLGEAASSAEAQALLLRYRATDLEAVLREVAAFWDDMLGTVQVKTPSRSLDIILNRWMLYQTLACRVWARSAFYQASGAYGFRDQLQDCMALLVTRPSFARAQLLRAAACQFPQGDVQHWWLPAMVAGAPGQGVRTRITDDRVWLAYACATYVESTGETAILDVEVPFLEGPVLRPEEHEAFFMPTVSDQRATLFEHCALALDQSLQNGVHGLPLIGTGDWNDGMNRVGVGGAGESVWLAWFLYTTLLRFAPLAHARGEQARETLWLAHAAALRSALEHDAWDGNWYRRGYFDDGTPLGSASSTECRIDSIAQSWSVISQAADPARARKSMAAVQSALIQRQTGLALLFTPPFELTPLDPGYIKGYPPGIRENGGQYTHAATWSVIAHAMLGEGEQAFDLFNMLNPITHAATRADVLRYKVEPYVVAADVYSVTPHVGRGGWTWYTGSAGWMYRAGLEWILGFRLQGATLWLEPCIPAAWPGFEIVFKYHSARYEIHVENPDRVCRGIGRTTLDGTALPAGATHIALVDDGRQHSLDIVLGEAAAASVSAA